MIVAAMAAQASHGTATISTPMLTISRKLVQKLKLENAIHVGHSTGGGEVARYIGRHGTEHVSKLCDRLRGLAETLGCRTNLRVARPVSTAGERLRKSIPQRFGVPPPRLNPLHAT
jgi:pimeloyl-ACP methyl ester carboxylesterase